MSWHSHEVSRREERINVDVVIKYMHISQLYSRKGGGGEAQKREIELSKYTGVWRLLDEQTRGYEGAYTVVTRQDYMAMWVHACVYVGVYG